MTTNDASDDQGAGIAAPNHDATVARPADSGSAIAEQGGAVEVEPAEAYVGGRPSKRTDRKILCAVTGKPVPKRRCVPLYSLRPSLADRIHVDFPELATDAPISREAVGEYRAKLVEELLHQERGEISELEKQVAASMAEHAAVSENIESIFDSKRSIGEILSDHLASFGGSWSFLISFGLVLTVWIIINLFQGDKQAFDPYPFILLNLVLSCIAAIQAPVIMMSQRRQDERDRLRSLNDYKINLKAELEIQHLHEKIDYLLSRQWERLAEIQQIQMDVMQKGKI